MPDVAKLVSPPPDVATLNSIYNNQILDIQFDTITKTGSEEQGYSILRKLVKEGDNAEDIIDSHPCFDYKPFMSNITLFDTPTGYLVIYKFC